jgi:hypothetical protein
VALLLPRSAPCGEEASRPWQCPQPLACGGRALQAAGRRTPPGAPGLGLLAVAVATPPLAAQRGGAATAPCGHRPHTSGASQRSTGRGSGHTYAGGAASLPGEKPVVTGRQVTINHRKKKRCEQGRPLFAHYHSVTPVFEAASAILACILALTGLRGYRYTPAMLSVRSGTDPLLRRGKAPSVLPSCRALGCCGLRSTPHARIRPGCVVAAHIVGPTLETDTLRVSVFVCLFPVFLVFRLCQSSASCCVSTPCDGAAAPHRGVSHAAAPWQGRLLPSSCLGWRRPPAGLRRVPVWLVCPRGGAQGSTVLFPTEKGCCVP